jgi:hypothetical protein
MDQSYNFALSPQSNRSETMEPPRSPPDSEESNTPVLSIGNYKKYSHDIEKTYAVGSMTYHSMTLDLVGIYLKGQKLLYTESKTYCEMMLYALMLPAIFISTLCTVLNVPLKNESYGTIVVSALNGFNSFLLSVVTYLKLDAKAEAHKTSAYQFDKLQTMCEFYSGKTLLLMDQNISESVNAFIDNIEKKVSEIKDANQFIIPEPIRYRYNDIYSYNVFVVMKEYKTTRILNVQKLLDVTNEIEWRKKQVIVGEDDIQSRYSPDIIPPPRTFLQTIGIRKRETEDTDEKYRTMNIYDPATTLSNLYKIREICIKDIIQYRNLSSNLNRKFNEQVEIHIDERTNKWHRSIFNVDLLKV